jgi:SAM-dependent methyltransferase
VNDSKPTEFWDGAARSREFTHALDHERLQSELSRQARILDYGCGQGRLAAELIARGYDDVVGVDSSPEMVRAAAERAPDARFSVVNALPLPFESERFDAVLLFAVLTCIPSDADQRALIGELERVLAPGGLLVVSDYPLQSDDRNLARYDQFAGELGYGRFRLPEGAVLRHHPDAWFAELLAGFVVEERVERSGRTMNGNPARLVQFWARRPWRADPAY